MGVTGVYSGDYTHSSFCTLHIHTEFMHKHIHTDKHFMYIYCKIAQDGMNAQNVQCTELICMAHIEHSLQIQLPYILVLSCCSDAFTYHECKASSKDKGEGG